jgi:hypothetical protein
MINRNLKRGSQHLLWLVVVLVVIAGCKQKKVSLSGDDPVTSSDFIESFEKVTLPFQVTDTMLERKEKDSLLISYKVFTQFVPDSVINKVFGKNVKPKLYPLGRVVNDKKDNYLFAKAIHGERRVAYLLCFDKNNKFFASMPVLIEDASSSTQQVFNMDKHYALYKNISRKNSDGTISEGKDVYTLDDASGLFTLVMTDALEDEAVELINPIDTLPQKNKFSGDYVVNKNNIVSIRDGAKNGKMLFFIHFEKENGTCNGELKGEANLTSANSAMYRSAGDPCVLQFSFTSSSVSLKEGEGCGSHRDLRCLFDGTYPKKKEVKKSSKKK